MVSDSVFDLAIEVAKSSTSRVKVGAVLLSKNKVVCSATNLDSKSHPTQAKFAKMAGLKEKIYLHAEMAALVKCRTEVDTIVVTRINPQGKLRLSKPCPICSLALNEAGIKKVYYSTPKGFLYEYDNEHEIPPTIPAS